MEAAFHGGQQPVNAVGTRRGQFLAQQRIRSLSRCAPRRAGFKRADAFLQRFLESAADGHHFADGLHLRAQRTVRAGEFLELPFRDFHHDVVDGGLEASRRFLGDIVGNFIEAHAHSEPCGNFRDRETGGFAGERRAARHTRIHLYDDHAAVFRIDGELHVRPAGFHAHFSDDGGRGISHPLIFLVGQRLRGSHRDGVAGMHAHRVEVFNRADDHEVVAEVAHHFEFILFPAEHGLFDQRLVNRAQVQRRRNGFGKFFLVVGNRAAGTAESERRANHKGEAELVAEPHRIFRVIHQRGRRNFQADFAARVLEPQSVFGDFDRAK